MEFRHSASFGKRMEYYIIGKMLKEGLDVFIPLVDDDGVDAIIRHHDSSFCSVQIKARSETADEKSFGHFVVNHHEKRENYWLIFYSAYVDKMWIMTSEEFLTLSIKSSKSRKIIPCCFGKGKNSRINYPEKFCKYQAENFARLQP